MRGESDRLGGGESRGGEAATEERARIRNLVVSWILVHGPLDYVQDDDDVEDLTDLYAEAMRAGVERAAQECMKAVPNAHTYASENADIYIAGEDARDRCIAAIRKLAPPLGPPPTTEETLSPND